MAVARQEPIATMLEHIKLLASVLGSDKYHAVKVIVQENWSAPIVELIDGVYDKYDKLVESGKTFTLEDLKSELSFMTDGQIKSYASACFKDERYIFLARRLYKLYWEPSELKHVEYGM